jgi:hypothetical protein
MTDLLLRRRLQARSLLLLKAGTADGPRYVFPGKQIMVLTSSQTAQQPGVVPPPGMVVDDEGTGVPAGTAAGAPGPVSLLLAHNGTWLTLPGHIADAPVGYYDELASRMIARCVRLSASDAALQENRLAQMASIDQQREIMRYMRGLNEWLERDVHDRQAEMRGVSARVDQLRQDLGRLSQAILPGTLHSQPLVTPL